jgi:hypothetical protein
MIKDSDFNFGSVFGVLDAAGMYKDSEHKSETSNIALNFPDLYRALCVLEQEFGRYEKEVECKNKFVESAQRLSVLFDISRNKTLKDYEYEVLSDIIGDYADDVKSCATAFENIVC